MTTGSVEVDGNDVRSLTLASLRSHIGVVLDEPFLFSSSIRDNIAYGRPDADIADVEAAAVAAGADEFIRDLPEGYDTVVGERGYTMSGGQRQRIAIARTLLVNPPILILDDATSAVDVQVEQQIHESLRVLMEGRTTLVIAHRLSTIGLADRVVLMDEGTVVAEGTHNELLATTPSTWRCWRRSRTRTTREAHENRGPRAQRASTEKEPSDGIRQGSADGWAEDSVLPVDRGCATRAGACRSPASPRSSKTGSTSCSPTSRSTPNRTSRSPTGATDAEKSKLTIRSLIFKHWQLGAIATGPRDDHRAWSTRRARSSSTSASTTGWTRRTSDFGLIIVVSQRSTWRHPRELDHAASA